MSHVFDDRLAHCLTSHLMALLWQRAGTATICPSEAARAAANELLVDWQDLMRPVRSVAADLAARGKIEVLQQDRQVDIRDVRGPIQLRLKSAHYA
jgi:hypothetical protein